MRKREHPPVEKTDPGAESLPPDFRPGFTTRMRVWRSHRRLHEILRAELARDGQPGKATFCAHCGRGWVARQMQYGTYLRETRR
jgi:hypothetical protein